MTSKMNVDMFEHECVGAGKTFGRNHEVEVTFEGGQPFTREGRVNLPAMARDKSLTKQQVNIGRGYTAMEAGKLVNTDMGAYTKAVFNEKGEVKQETFPQLVNALEQVRVSRKVHDQYPGETPHTSALMDSVNKSFRENHYESNPEIVNDFESIGPIACMWEGMRRQGVSEKSIEEQQAILPEKLRNIANVANDALDECESTSDVINLARRLAKQLEEESPEGGGGSNKGQGERGEEGGEEGEGTPEHKDDEGVEGDRKGVGDLEHDAASRKMPELTANIEKEFRGVVNVKGSKSYRVFTTAYDTLFTRETDRDLGDPVGARRYDKVLEGMGGKVNVMKRKLERALMAKQNRGWDPAREHGRLDSRRLVAAHGGAPNVFKQREEVPEIDTAVTLLVDCSGSMNGSEIKLAQQAVIALAEALAKTGVALEVLGFTNDRNLMPRKKFGEFHELRERGERFSRVEPLRMYNFKDFDEGLRRAKVSMGNITRVEMGNNSDGDALMVAYGRLAKRPEKRKIMLTLSDGHPACMDDTGLQDWRLRTVIEFLGAQGVSCVGIGIQDSAVSHYYPKYQVIHDLDDLAKGVLDNLARMILGDRFKVDNSDLMGVDKSDVRRMKRSA